MSSAITLPTFYEKEKLTYQKLNAAMASINAKFAAGVGAAELSWPLTAEGNLDMSVYAITGGRAIWGYVNAAEYDTLDDAISAAGSGGVVLVPPETTVVANGASVTGTGVTVIGSGPSSVLQLTGSASSGYLLRFNSAARGLLANLTIDGNSSTGSAQNGVNIVDTSRMFIANVAFRNFSGNALEISGATTHVTIGGCTFDGSNRQMYVTQCQELTITGCTFNGSTTAAIGIACASGTAFTAVAMGDCVITSSGAEGFRFTGFNSIGNTSPGRLWLSNVAIMSAGGTAKDGIVAGTSSAILEEANISNCTVRTATAGGILVNANHGNVTGCQIDNPTTFGIDLATSRYMILNGNYVYSATIGVDASAGQTCMVINNILRDCTVVVARGGTNHVINNNLGDMGGCPTGQVQMVYNGTTKTYSGTGTSQTVGEFEIPADTLRQGSVMRMHVFGESGDDGVAPRALKLKIGADTICNVNVNGANINGVAMLVDCYVSSYTDGALEGNGVGVKEGAMGSTGGAMDSSKFILSGLDFTSAITCEVEANQGTTNIRGVFVYYHHAVEDAWSA